jgi:hypothetical protein
MITEEQVVALIAAANPVPNPDLLDPLEPLDRLDRAAAGGDVVADVERNPVRGPRGRSRIRLVAAGLIAAGLVAAFALVTGSAARMRRPPSRRPRHRTG